MLPISTEHCARLQLNTVRAALIAVFFACHVLGVSGEAPTVRILIVGSGINGAAVSYFLRNISAELGVGGSRAELDITVAERSSRVGGRIRSVQVDNEGAPAAVVELGASVYHDVNQYMEYFVRMLDLQTSHPYGSSKLGVFDGAGGQMPFAESDLASTCASNKYEGVTSLPKQVLCRLVPSEVLQLFDQAITAIAAVGRYWLDPFHAQGCVEVLVSRLLEVYKMQSGPRGESCSSSTQLLRRLGLLEPAADISLEDYLTSGRLLPTASGGQAVCTKLQATAFLDELVHSFTMINYGQVPEKITALAGAVAMKGKGSEVHSISGGNARLVEKLLDFSKAKVVTDVDVSWLGGHTFAVSGKNAPRILQPVDKHFDIIIIAHPTNGVRGGTAPPMHSTFVSIVRGKLNASTISTAPAASSKLPTILTVTARGKQRLGGIRSVGRLQGSDDRYKIFSDRPLSVEQLEEDLFSHGSAELITTHVWEGAYPLYTVRTDQQVSASPLSTSFILHDGDGSGPSVLYSGALESYVSTMETQCIGARNTALLVLQKYLVPLAKERSPKSFSPTVEDDHEL